MTEIRFYHLHRLPLERALPRLLEKVLQSGARAVVLAGSPERVEALDSALWTFAPDSFLPHGSGRDPHPERQPVWLTTVDENPNGATVLVLTDGAWSSKVDAFEKCLDIFDGADAQAQERARDRWRAYAAAGFTVTYWQQDESGRWTQKS
jgi:DNA polymerase III, chi subunit